MATMTDTQSPRQHAADSHDLIRVQGDLPSGTFAVVRSGPQREWGVELG